LKSAERAQSIANQLKGKTDRETLGNIARWAGRKLRWDPVKEIFPDDPDANQYLDRQRRKPYELPESV